MSSAAPNPRWLEAIDHWMYAVRRMALPQAGFEERQLPGGVAIWGNVAFPLVNEVFLTEMLADSAGVHRFLDSAEAFANERGLPWMLALCDYCLPPRGDGVLSARGYAIAMGTTYMVTDRIEPPVRELPSCEMRPIRTAADAAIMSDLNCAAYGMPLEMGRSALADESMFASGAYGAIAEVGGTPVSTASVLFEDDCLNVVCVATDEEHRRRGYAEAVMRHALAESSRITGRTRTVLHATDAGYSIYARMGYQPIAPLTVWAQGGHE